MGRIRVLEDSMEDAIGSLDTALECMKDAMVHAPGLKPLLEPKVVQLEEMMQELVPWRRILGL